MLEIGFIQIKLGEIAEGYKRRKHQICLYTFLRSYTY
jgi:hypothetical protein